MNSYTLGIQLVLLTSCFSHGLLTFLPPANVVCEGYVFTPVCDSVKGGSVRGCSEGCMVARGGGVHGCSGGACMVAPGGAYVVARGVCGCSWGGGMHGCSEGHAWLLWGVWVVAPGGHVWLLGGACVGYDKIWRYGHERAVRILLECILVSYPLTSGWLGEKTSINIHAP